MFNNPIPADLIRKYDVPTPRYTSYPTVPHWDTDNFSHARWENAVRRSFDETNDTCGISLYIHLPFCESLCTYCACNKRITRNHGVEPGYIESILREWQYYLTLFGRKPLIRELHLGGGTPTFFSPENLERLVSALLRQGMVHPDREFSFEGHPNNTTKQHLQTLYDLGFRRVSFGVQDLDPKVQKTINRIQPFENVRYVTDESRRIGYTSVSFDLIYGLPHQTCDSVANTFHKVLELRPDRVSYYSYAHVPWVSPGQRGYDEDDLPSDLSKRALYETGRALLRDNNYRDIGMDHFALPDDAMYAAVVDGRLHRNFMGYTTTNTELLIGLGASAISDAKYAYAQNLKKVEAYSEAVRQKGTAVFKGHIQLPEDLTIRATILAIACKGYIPGKSAELGDGEALTTMCSEGILVAENDGYRVTETGRAFVRNVCSVFDRKLRQEALRETSMRFSQSI